MISPALGVSAAETTGVHVLDVAAGNGRFSRYLAEKLAGTGTKLMTHSVDLLPEATQQLDITGALLRQVYRGGPALETLIHAEPADFTVSFGFMHHLPGAALRRAFLRALLAKTRPGGICAVSCWQFAQTLGDGRAYPDHSETPESPELPGLPADVRLDAGDFILGFQNRSGARRYCHSFSDAEIDELCREGLKLTDPQGSGTALDIESGAFAPLMRFSADLSKKGACNVYLVWQR